MKVSCVVVALMPLLLLLSGAAARDLSNPGYGRSLLQTCNTATCQTCVSKGTGAGKKCKTCKNNMAVLRSSNVAVDGTCGCLAGTHFDGTNACVVCPKNKYCPGGTTAASLTPVDCPTNMQTLTTGAKKISACVNNPGYKYVPAAGAGQAPTAVVCAADDNTYSPGLKQQQQCRKCPSGFVTNGEGLRTSIADCYAPPGYYVNAAGVAVKCPKGEWKAGYNVDTLCTRCITGVTTEFPGSTSVADCNTLRPGFRGKLVSAADGIIAPELCPRDKFCSGATLVDEDPGFAGASDCINGRMTQSTGAIADSQCMVPPGHKTNGAGVVSLCPDNNYREGWRKIANNIGCTACGNGVLADIEKAPLSFYDDAGTLIATIEASTSAESCYITAGQGLIKMADGTFQAQDCDGANQYGAPVTQFGLVAAPCKQCPFNMETGPIADNAASFSPDNMAIGPDACITKPGYGYDGRVSEQCVVGTYSTGGSRDPCTPCPAGQTTAAAGAAADTLCKSEPGRDKTTGELCPVGFFSAIDSDCEACAALKSTLYEGSTSQADCILCLDGYYWDGDSCELCAAGTYLSSAAASGDPGTCTGTCLSTTFFLQGSDMLESDMPLAMPGTSAAGSASASDCVALFGQLVLNDYGPIVTVDALTTVPGVTVVQCLQNCDADADCQFVNIEYSNSDGTIVCKKRSVTQAWTTATTYTMFGVKQVPAGDVQAESSNAQSTGSGKFTFWADATAAAQLASTTQLVTPGTNPSTAEECQDACTSNVACAGIVMTYDNDVYGTCKYVIPVAAPAGSAASNTRTLLRAVPAQTNPVAVAAAHAA